jgi:hypothetical protein
MSPARLDHRGSEHEIDGISQSRAAALILAFTPEPRAAAVALPAMQRVLGRLLRAQRFDVVNLELWSSAEPFDQPLVSTGWVSLNHATRELRLWQSWSSEAKELAGAPITPSTNTP